MANQTIYNCILERIRVAEPESVFVSTDYVDLADVNTVRPADWIACRAPIAISSLLQKTTSI